MRLHPYRVLLLLLFALAVLAAGRWEDESRRAGDESEPARAAEASPSTPAGTTSAPRCEPGNGGITLPEGFCAVLVAERVGSPRHLAVAPDGDVYAALRGGRDGAGGGAVALRDTTGDGRADVVRRFGPEASTTGIALAGDFLYLATNDAVLRYELAPTALVPAGEPQTLVRELPTDRSHRAKSIALAGEGELFVNIGSPSNVCQEADGTGGSRGQDPCPELETRAGVWRFDAKLAGQTQADGRRFATGLRNTLALEVHPVTGALYGLQQGRDRLHQDWPKLYDADAGAEKPSEIFVRIDEGDDFGWPYCYHDPELGRHVLAPEYGGDGRTEGRCADVERPLVAFPGHWAPLGLLFYGGEQFPERYRGGAFVAFHGSWNRAPLPQGGYNVSFVPMREGSPAGPYEVFADGFAGGNRSPEGARHRPAGLGQGPDGSLYVSDDTGGNIWRIMYQGAETEAEPGASSGNRTPEAGERQRTDERQTGS